MSEQHQSQKQQRQKPTDINKNHLLGTNPCIIIFQNGYDGISIRFIQFFQCIA